MPLHTRTFLGLGLAVALALTGCSDVPTSLAPDGAASAKGGVKGPNDGGGGNDGGTAGDMATLGQSLFFDASLSVNGNQSCSSCHEPTQGFAAPAAGTAVKGAVVEGSIPGAFGNRKPPSVAYATLAPTLSGSGNSTTGGNFWDGRATGDVLGNPAADQAMGPFVNPAEQALPDKACVLYRITKSTYLDTWTAVWGDAIVGLDYSNAITICGDTNRAVGEYLALTQRTIVDEAYQQVALSIQAFEETINTFSSAFDAGTLTQTEQDGDKLFSSKGKCHQCHDAKGSRPLFTDFQYHNLGVPEHPELSAAEAFPDHGFDPGLGGFTGIVADLGKFKTPTVRNVAVGNNRSYMHNGSLISLRQVVQFYNTRDVLPVCTDETVLADPAQWGPDGAGCWPAPEHPDNLDTQNMGNLGLTSDEVEAIVAFMEALSDGEVQP